MPFKFHGGVHPNYMKAPDVPVTVIAPPPQVVLPMMQHIGAPCKPLVAVGDYVKMGQKIADNPAPVSAPIHATVSGKVIAIEPRPHPLGDMIPAIVIENDFQDTPCTDLAPLTPEQMKDPEAILERIREAGIVGHGGAMFPTAFKIRGGLGKVDTLIINGAECEPYLNGDHLTMKTTLRSCSRASSWRASRPASTRLTTASRRTSRTPSTCCCRKPRAVRRGDRAGERQVPPGRREDADQGHHEP